MKVIVRAKIRSILLIVIIQSIFSIIFGQAAPYGFKSDCLKISNLDSVFDSLLVFDPQTEVYVPLLGKNRILGYPVLNCTFNDGNWEFPTNRFLALNNSNKYCVIDSNLRIVIDFSDTIVALTESEWEFYNIPCSPPDSRGGQLLYYQAVRNNLTYLYDYEGKLIFENPYSGLIPDDSYSKNNSYTIIWNGGYNDWRTCLMGLIDSTGKQVIPVGNYRISYFVDFNLKHPLFEVTDSSYYTNLINVKTGKIIVTFDAINWVKQIDNDLFIFCFDTKFGIFHTNKGVIVKPKYDKINKNHEKNELLLVKGKKVKRKKISELK